jgi:hypothetical protein
MVDGRDQVLTPQINRAGKPGERLFRNVEGGLRNIDPDIARDARAGESRGGAGGRTAAEVGKDKIAGRFSIRTRWSKS